MAPKELHDAMRRGVITDLLAVPELLGAGFTYAK